MQFVNLRKVMFNKIHQYFTVHLFHTSFFKTKNIRYPKCPSYSFLFKGVIIFRRSNNLNFTLHNGKIQEFNLLKTNLSQLGELHSIHFKKPTKRMKYDTVYCSPHGRDHTCKKWFLNFYCNKDWHWIGVLKRFC